MGRPEPTPCVLPSTPAAEARGASFVALPYGQPAGFGWPW